MQTVREIMTRELVTVGPEDSVARAAEIMERIGIGGVPVVDAGRLVGILTSRDIRSSHPNRLVADAMTREVVTIPAASSLWEAKELLERHGIERLVVMEEDHPVGVVTKSVLYAELGKYVDGLTGLPQAEFLHRRSSELLRDGQEIAIIFLDLDDFGAVDKELGHVVGDGILRRVAKLLGGMVEEGPDYLVRYAGAEFAVVTLRSLEEAEGLALRMVDAISGEDWPPGVKLGASAGVIAGRPAARRRRDSQPYTIGDLINMASLASTRAKQEKKRVVVVGRMEL
ncbi:MAG: CBS domain-containing protein [Firmicutes bacterium]|nr:CBS domain-containing protein [Bacillota bacterium]